MSRMLSLFMATAVVMMGSVGCATTCGSCGSCEPKVGTGLFECGKLGGCGKVGGCGTCGAGCGPYWRNLGKAGKHEVGHSWCRKCDLCDEVGGPCGGWSKTSGGGCHGCVNDGSMNYSEPMIISGQMRHPSGPVYSTVMHPQAPRSAMRR